MQPKNTCYSLIDNLYRFFISCLNIEVLLNNYGLFLKKLDHEDSRVQGVEDLSERLKNLAKIITSGLEDSKCHGYEMERLKMDFLNPRILDPIAE
jgi:hypothetical protein